MATSNSAPVNPAERAVLAGSARPVRTETPRSRRGVWIWGLQRALSSGTALAALVLMVPVWPRCLRADPPLPRDFQAHLSRVQTEFDRAFDQWHKESNRVEAAWQFGRAAFDWAEFATNDHQRSRLAELGIASCRRGVVLDSNSVAAHYYLALNLGQLARTKLLGALKLIDEMEKEWSTAIQLDPKFDYGGPHRAIGVLYRDAPGWPTSIGSEKKSRQHLENAVKLHPEYPGNVISLQEGWIEWGEKKAVRDKATETDAFLKKARLAFSGESWAWDWADWDRRWTEIKKKAGVAEGKQVVP